MVEIIAPNKLIASSEVKNIYSTIYKYSIRWSHYYRRAETGGDAYHMYSNVGTTPEYIVSPENGIIFKVDGNSAYKMDTFTPYSGSVSNNTANIRYYTIGQTTTTLNTQTINLTSGTHSTTTQSNIIVVDLQTTALNLTSLAYDPFVYKVVGVRYSGLPIAVFGNPLGGVLNGRFLFVNYNPDVYLSYTIYFQNGSSTTFNVDANSYRVADYNNVVGISGGVNAYFIYYYCYAPVGFNVSSTGTYSFRNVTSTSSEVRIKYLRNDFHMI